MPPLTRINANADGPGGVLNATIVSFELMWNEFNRGTH